MLHLLLYVTLTTNTHYLSRMFISYESSLFLAVVGSLVFAACAWLFSYKSSLDMFDELRRMDKRQVRLLLSVILKKTGTANTPPSSGTMF